jgi:hypothetical protein
MVVAGQEVNNIFLFLPPAVIFPTVWRYIQNLGVYDETYLGFTISGEKINQLQHNHQLYHRHI